ncbi:MAG: CBS domain-containing protein, partial [Halobacteria archaeon]|nr:CBS domain-containing protein [Halobacteria archaeon]
DLLDLIDERQEDKNIWLPSPFEAIELPLRAFPWKEWLEKHEIIKSTVEDIGATPVRKIMSDDVKNTEPDETVEEAAHTMVRFEVNRLPVVENGELAGIVTRGDIIQGLGE